MKKTVGTLLCITVLFGSLFTGCSRKGISRITIDPYTKDKEQTNLQWKESNYKATLEPYTVKPDLTDISNLSILDVFSNLEKSFLSNDLFLIKEADEHFEQPFDLYEKNNEEGIPNLITSDSLLHSYHLMIDNIVESIEKERLVDEVKEFTKRSFDRSLEIYNGIKNTNMKHAALKNVAYFGIAMRLLELDLPGGIPMEANRIIDNDVKKVKTRWNSGSSEIFPYYIDYQRYIVKGHYSRETDFRNYYLVMMWYGNTPMYFEMYNSKNDSYKRMDDQIAMSVIMSVQTTGDPELRRLWEDIYGVTTMVSGKMDDVNLYDMSDIIRVIYGEKIDLGKVWDAEQISQVYELAKQRYNLHSTETIGSRISFSNKDKKRQTQFRLMGNMYSIDSDIYSNLTVVDALLTGESRTMPKGLDIPSAFGSSEAYSILRDDMEEDTQWSGYTDVMNRLQTVLAGAKGDNPADYSMTNSIFWVLKSLIQHRTEGYPSFMTGDNWRKRELISFAGTVSDTRHLSSMTAKSGQTDEIQTSSSTAVDIPGYVEPYVEVYERFEYMAQNIKAYLTNNGFSNNNDISSLDAFSDAAKFLKDISIKELEDKPFTEEEEKRLRDFSMELKSLTLNSVNGKENTKQWEMVPEVDRNMASVTDAYIYDDQVLQTYIGSPDYIYAIVPYQGKLYITRGCAYTYYESVEPISKKLDDTKWQRMIKDQKQMELQDWIKDIRIKDIE